MIKELTYEQTVELEENIKLKDRANAIYQNFLDNVKLEPKKYVGGGRFIYWEDSHNSIYFMLDNDKFSFICHFLHESYNIEVTPSGIFNALKNKSRGVEHLISHVQPKPQP